MSDLIFVALIVAFFALAAVFVGACERIIGSTEAAPAADAIEASTRAGRASGRGEDQSIHDDDVLAG